MQRVLLTGLLVFSLQIALGQSRVINDKKGIVSFCDTFMRKFCENKIEEAFQGIKAYSPVAPGEIDKMGVLVKRQIESLGDLYGKIISFELVDEKNIKDVLLNMSYVLKYEKSCMKFDFLFYNNGAGWTLNHFNYVALPETFFK